MNSIKSKLNILYCHGLGSSINNRHGTQLKAFFEKNYKDSVYFERFLYKNPGSVDHVWNINEWRKDIEERIENQKWIIISTSAAGHCALNIAKSKPHNILGLFMFCPGTHLDLNFVNTIAPGALELLKKKGSLVYPPSRNGHAALVTVEAFQEYSDTCVTKTPGDIAIKCPITVVQGTADDLVPHQNTVKLVKRLTSKNVELVTLEGATHYFDIDERIQGKIDEFISKEGLDDGELRLISAFLYEDEIVVTTSRQRTTQLGIPVYCRYFDCNRVEIPDSIYKAFFFPLTSVHCLRKVGASYISLSLAEDEKPQLPIPFVHRLFKEPQHELGVCSGQLYGMDAKWMQIAEFVEHHKLIGATMFYFSVFEIDGMTRMILDEYERSGFAEVSMINTEYTNAAMMRHMVQIHECFYRARKHSKWLLNIDHDEFLIPRAKPILSYIRSLGENVAESVFSMRRIAKFEESIEKYNNIEEVSNDIQASNYNLTHDPTYTSVKVMIRPDKVNAILLHWAYGMEPDYKVNVVPKNIAFLNHYRTISPNYLWSDFMAKLMRQNVKFLHVTMQKEYVERLRENVVQVVGYVFKKHDLTCENIPSSLQRATKPYLKKMKICE
ncbi:unnamed protein product [Caenorhabditis angaria]|uniref:Glycosyltransferase family 92 protein n=1 Tax=Caenorhabditis angaria TaxID=860376 RepID=A0A9P1IV31_9PELO|nr:unnamed protein product [Caenorhabditis angaria]